METIAESFSKWRAKSKKKRLKISDNKEVFTKILRFSAAGTLRNRFYIAYTKVVCYNNNIINNEGLMNFVSTKFLMRIVFQHDNFLILKVRTDRTQSIL